MKILCYLKINWIVIRNFNFALRRRTLHEKIIKAAQREILEGSGKLRFISASRQGTQTRKKKWSSIIVRCFRTNAWWRVEQRTSALRCISGISFLTDSLLFTKNLICVRAILYMLPRDLTSSIHCFVFFTYVKLMELGFQYQILWFLITEFTQTFSLPTLILMKQTVLVVRSLFLQLIRVNRGFTKYVFNELSRTLRKIHT